MVHMIFKNVFLGKLNHFSQSSFHPCLILRSGTAPWAPSNPVLLSRITRSESEPAPHLLPTAVLSAPKPRRGAEGAGRLHTHHCARSGPHTWLVTIQMCMALLAICLGRSSKPADPGLPFPTCTLERLTRPRQHRRRRRAASAVPWRTCCWRGRSSAEPPGRQKEERGRLGQMHAQLCSGVRVCSSHATVCTIRNMSQHEVGGKRWRKNGKISWIVYFTGNMWKKPFFSQIHIHILWEPEFWNFCKHTAKCFACTDSNT